MFFILLFFYSAEAEATAASVVVMFLWHWHLAPTSHCQSFHWRLFLNLFRVIHFGEGLSVTRDVLYQLSNYMYMDISRGGGVFIDFL